MNTHSSALCCTSGSRRCCDFTLAAPSPRNTSPHGGFQRGAASPLRHVPGERTANCVSVLLLRAALLGVEPHSPSALLLSRNGVSWQPRDMNLTRASGQTEPSFSFLVSCSIFQHFQDLSPKVGQQQTAPGQCLKRVSISRGKGWSLFDAGVSLSRALLQCPGCGCGTVLPYCCSSEPGRDSSGGAAFTVKPTLHSKPPALAVLGCGDGS